MTGVWPFKSLIVAAFLGCVSYGQAVARIPVENSMAFDRLNEIASKPTGLLFYRICKLRGAQYGSTQNSNLLWILSSERPVFGYLFMITPEGLLLVRGFEIVPSGAVGGELNVGTELQRELNDHLGVEFGFKFRSVLSGPGALEKIFSDSPLDRCMPPDVGP